MATRPTITDIAKLCGVTAVTVSYVLNRKPGVSVSAATREKVFAAAQQLGYSPDLSARKLNRQESRIIGVFTNPQTHLSEGLTEQMIRGFSSVLQFAGYDVYLQLSSLADEERSLPFWRFDGAILMHSPKPITVQELDERKVPYVCINDRMGHPIAEVLSDDALGMNRVLDHLAQLGHRTIGYANARLAHFFHYSVTERHNTLVAGAAARQMQLVDPHDGPFSSATEMVRHCVIKGGATAMVAYDHQIAVMLLCAAASLGLKVPQQFSLVCFNDLLPAALFIPPITAVAVNGHEMGRIGGSLLANHLLTAAKLEERVIRVPEDLVVRASTAPPGG